MSIEQRRGSKSSVRLKHTYRTCRRGQQQYPEATEITANNRDYLIRTNLPADRAFIPNTHRKSANRGSKARLSTASQDTSITTYFDKNSKSSVRTNASTDRACDCFSQSLKESIKQSELVKIQGALPLVEFPEMHRSSKPNSCCQHLNTLKKSEPYIALQK